MRDTMVGRSWVVACALLAAACGRDAATPQPTTGAPAEQGTRVDGSPSLEATADALLAPRMREGAPALVVPGSLDARFDGDGAHVSLVGTREPTRIALVAIGRGAPESDGMRDASGARASIAGPRVELARAALPGIVEWWRALPSGLEHGVTLATRPPGGEPLVLEVVFEGLGVRAASDDAALLVVADGRVVGQYASLAVLDADGAAVPARMSVREGRVRIEIDDAGASYPLVVDPLITAHEATLLAPDGSPFDYYGYSLALSADASRALVGAIYDATLLGYDAGSVRVLVRSGAMWTEEQVLLASDAGDVDQLGSAVSITADGTRALAGASGDETVAGRTGSARVFARSGTTWAEEATLLPAGGGAEARFGAAAAISADGTRAIVGSYWADGPGGVNSGTATVFSRVGSAWTLEQTLAASDGAPDEWFGFAVAISDDGSRALVGVPYDDAGGSARSFVRAGTTWTEEATLRPAGALANDTVGRAVALDGDATRAIVASPGDDVGGQTDAGSATVFLRAGATWTAEALLVAPDLDADDFFGWSLALDESGARALVGTSGDDTLGGAGAGSARVFTRAGTTWSHEGTLLAGAGAAGDSLGDAVALADDGTRALVGADHDDSNTGSAHVFTVLATGGACSTAAECDTGFCVDGRCCNTACGGGAVDCQACSVAAGGVEDGTCTALTAVAAPATTCRAAAGDCDLAETCTAGSTVCPGDALLPASTTCRASAGDCDVAESCTGSAASCPLDAFLPASTTCRASAGDCDVAEVCTGSAASCPLDAFLPSSTTCRASAGDCDAAEVCTGSAASCPLDAFLPSSTTCRASAGDCDAAESCTGSASSCPLDAFLPSSTTCRASIGACDLDETCSGAGATCPADAFQPAGHECAPASGAECDVPDVCAGDSATCVETFATSDTACGPAAVDACDAPDHCAGTSTSCVSELVAAGVPCRASVDPTCDPEETCDGVATTCPDDVDTCSPDGGMPPDAGAGDAGTADEDAGAALDASAPDDAGIAMSDAALERDAGDADLEIDASGSDAGPPSGGGGCSCRVSPSRPASPAAFLAAACLALLAARRRRRPRASPAP